jgi:hypothetical protein
MPIYVGVKMKEKIWSLNVILNPMYVEFFESMRPTADSHLPTAAQTHNSQQKNTKHDHHGPPDPSPSIGSKL